MTLILDNFTPLDNFCVYRINVGLCSPVHTAQLQELMQHVISYIISSLHPDGISVSIIYLVIDLRCIVE